MPLANLPKPNPIDEYGEVIRRLLNEDEKKKNQNVDMNQQPCFGPPPSTCPVTPSTLHNHPLHVYPHDYGVMLSKHNQSTAPFRAWSVASKVRRPYSSSSGSSYQTIRAHPPSPPRVSPHERATTGRHRGTRPRNRNSARAVSDKIRKRFSEINKKTGISIEHLRAIDPEKAAWPHLRDDDEDSADPLESDEYAHGHDHDHERSFEYHNPTRPPARRPWMSARGPTSSSSSSSSSTSATTASATTPDGPDAPPPASMPVSGSVDGWRTYRNYDPNIHCPASRRDAQIKQRIKAQQRVVNAKLKYQKPFSTRIQEDVKFLNKRAFEKAKTDITREVNRNYSYFLGTQYATSRFKNYVSANISDNIRPAAAKKGDPNSKNYGNHHHHHHHGHSHDSHGHDGDGHTLDSEKSTTSRLNRLYISRPLKKHNRSFLNPQAQTDRQRRLQDWQTKERKRREKLKLHMKKLRKSLQNSQHEHEQYQGYRDGIPLEHALDDIKHFLDFPHAVPRDRGDDHGSSAAASKHDDTDTRGKHSRESDDIGHAVVSGGGKTPPTRPNPDQHYNKLVYKYRGSLDVRTRDHWKHEVRQPVSSTYYNASEEAQPVMDKLAFHPREARLFRNMWTPSTLLTSQHFEQA